MYEIARLFYEKLGKSPPSLDLRGGTAQRTLVSCWSTLREPRSKSMNTTQNSMCDSRRGRGLEIGFEHTTRDYIYLQRRR
jgi:hypothetical protein